MSPIPVTIITGFLGSGKTTLINALLRDHEFTETAILINEFGDTQIDHDLVAEFSDDLVMTTTGCLCCTASSDIKQSLFDLWRQRKDRKIGPFKRVIVETTGLLDPVPVISSLLSPPAPGLMDSIVSQQFALSRVITLFDVVNGAQSLVSFPEAVRQVALADAVVLTKTDLAEGPTCVRRIEQDRRRLLALNPSLQVSDRQGDWSEIRKLFLDLRTYDLRTKGEDAIAWLDAERLQEHDHDHDHHDRTRHGDDIRSHVMIVDQPLSQLRLNLFIEALKLHAGTDLLRLKGLVALKTDPERPVVVHGVQHLVHPIDQLDQWPSDDKRTRIVLIGRNLDVDMFRNVLRAT